MMRIHLSRYVLLVALLVMLWTTETMAATIGFDYLDKPNLSPFMSYTYTNNTPNTQADDFTVKATGGQWFEAHIFGNGVPAIGAGPVYNANPGESQTITVMGGGGGLFTFGGVDLTSNSAVGTSYTIEGFLATSGVNSIFTQTVVIGDSSIACSSNCNINTFYSINSSSARMVDKLTITGTRGRGVTSFNIDNIRLSAATISCQGPGHDPNCPHPPVPEPASIMLLGVGLAGIEIWRRRRGEG